MWRQKYLLDVGQDEAVALRRILRPVVNGIVRSETVPGQSGRAIATRWPERRVQRVAPSTEVRVGGIAEEQFQQQRAMLDARCRRLVPALPDISPGPRRSSQDMQSLFARQGQAHEGFRRQQAGDFADELPGKAKKQRLAVGIRVGIGLRSLKEGWSRRSQLGLSPPWFGMFIVGLLDSAPTAATRRPASARGLLDACCGG